MDKILMFAPLVKKCSGKKKKFYAILSDDSIDRQDEIIDKSVLEKISTSMDNIPALLNHENNILNMVGKWVNKRIEKIDGHNALVAEPVFFESNPRAMEIKGMLEEGAEMGVSIGAIPYKSIEKNIDGQKYTAYTDGELLEASFVAIPANKHARAMAIAKSLNKKEEIKMSEEIEKKYEELSKSFESAKDELKVMSKKLEDVETELETVNKSLEEKDNKIIEMEKSLEEKDNELNDLNKKIEDRKSFVKLLREEVPPAEPVADIQKGLPVYR